MASFESDAGTSVVPVSILTQTDRHGEVLVSVKAYKLRFLCRVLARFCSCLRQEYPIRPLEQGDHSEDFLLPPQRAEHADHKTLVLDLDETLVHSSLQPFPDPDLTFSVPVEESLIPVYVRMRPEAREFLEYASKHFEVVIYTASVRSYADQLLDVLDTGHTTLRLFREHCEMRGATYLKQLKKLGRNMERVVLVDVTGRQNSRDIFNANQENCILIPSFYDDPSDRCLTRLVEVLELLRPVDDTRKYLGTADWDELTARLQAQRQEDESRELIPREDTMDDGRSQVNMPENGPNKVAMAERDV